MKNRPRRVWIIFIYYTLSLVGLIFFSLMLLYLPPAQSAFSATPILLPTILLYFETALNFAGALSLFFMRKFSIVFFALTLVSKIVYTLFMTIHPLGLLQNTSVFFRLSGATGWIIPLVVLIYVYKLTKTKALT